MRAVFPGKKTAENVDTLCRFFIHTTVYTLAAEKSNVLLEKVSQAWYYLFENNMASKNFDKDGVAFISR